MGQKGKEADKFKNLIWTDIEDWAGSRVVQRGKGYQSRVDNLAMTPDGGLIAYVFGGKKYTTSVRFNEGGLASRCTCPYGSSCKHAVAVVLDYLSRIEKGTAVPLLDSEDARSGVFAARAQGEAEGDGGPHDYARGAIKEESVNGRPTGTDRLRSYLEGKTKDDLVALLLEEAGKHPVVMEDLSHLERLSKGEVKKIIAEVRGEIVSLSEEPAWRNHWNNEGHIPDYSRVLDRLESLLSAGHADAVIALGEELFAAGTQQVEMSHDEGETAEEISSCLDVVFRALSFSSLSPADQMLWAITRELEDDYDLCSGSAFLWEEDRSPSDWGAVADALQERLNGLRPPDGENKVSSDYARNRLSDRIVDALEQAGRRDEIIPLCKAEVKKTGNYIRLVNILLEQGRKEEAEEWIRKGIKADPNGHLVDTLRKIREEEGNWLAVAAIRAAEFLHMPGLSAYDTLRAASQRAEVWPTVREAALSSLETGASPQSSDSWPLPESEVVFNGPRHRDKPPMVRTLLEIAIHEKRADDVLKWYDFENRKGRHAWRWDEHMENHVAKAIKDAHPDRALLIWKALAEAEIALTKPSAYDVAGRYLAEIGELLEGCDRGDEWTSYLAQLRQANARKSRFIRVLDRLEGQKKRILDGK